MDCLLCTKLRLKVSNLWNDLTLKRKHTGLSQVNNIGCTMTVKIGYVIWDKEIHTCFLEACLHHVGCVGIGLCETIVFGILAI